MPEQQKDLYAAQRRAVFGTAQPWLSPSMYVFYNLNKSIFQFILTFEQTKTGVYRMTTISEALFSALLIYVGVVLLSSKKNFIKQYLLFLLVATGLFISAACFEADLFTFLVLVLLTVLWTVLTRSIIELCTVPLVYIIECIIINLVLSLVQWLSEADVLPAYVDTFSAIITDVLSAMISLAFFYSVHRSKLFSFLRSTIKMHSRFVVAVTSAMLICFLEVFLMINYLGVINVSASERVLVCLIFVTFMGLIVFIVLAITKVITANAAAQNRIKELESLEEYTKNLETVYNKLRAFKHDYINIISSISGYLEDRQYDELESFFHDRILPISDTMIHDSAAVNNLDRIRIPSLKSIIYNKFIYAFSLGINVTGDFPSEIEEVNMDILDLIRVLGIFLDNAIEGALETPAPAMSVHIGTIGNETLFIIKNTYKENDLTISEMKKQGISSKGDNRGLGLPNAVSIIDRYSNVTWEMAKDGTEFTVSLSAYAPKQGTPVRRSFE